jgi:hypothetical protein
MLMPAGRHDSQNGPTPRLRLTPNATACFAVARTSVLFLCIATSRPIAAQTNSEDEASEVRDPPVATQSALQTGRARRTKPSSSKESKVRPSSNGKAAAAALVDAATEATAPSESDASATDVAADAGPEAAPQTSASAAPQPTLPPPAASASTSLAPSEYDIAEVKLRDSVILRLKLSDGGLTPMERVQRAKRAIEAALVDGHPEVVRTEMRLDRALIFVGQRPIVELTRADAEAIGEGSLELFAASAAARVTDLLENERQRSVVTRGAFNVVFVIASAVAVLYALRALGILGRRAREFVNRNPQRIPAIRLRSIEVVGPHVLRSGVVVGVGVAKLMLQVGLVFAWLLFSSSLFDATRGMTERLTAMLLAPLSGLAARFVALLPLLLLTTIGVVVLVVLLRFVALFFAGVERRETELTWLRSELAAPTSLLIRIGLVVLSLLVLAPLVTGNVDGALARVGMLSVVAIGLATTPLSANVVVGLVTLYGGRLQLGSVISIGPHTGLLASIDLVELRLTGTDGRVLRIPHLVTLVCPLTVSAGPIHRTRRLVVTAESGMERLLELVAGNEVLSSTTRLSVSKLEGKLATIELTPEEPSDAMEQQLLIEVARSFEAGQVRLILAEWRATA